jgi:hypothetical protein
MENPLIDLMEIAKAGGNVEQLLLDAYHRGVVAGKEIAKARMIEAIELEK